MPLLSFANNVCGIFILPKTKVDWLAQFFVAGPLSKLYLGYELWVQPVHFLHHGRGDALDPLSTLLGWEVCEGAGVAFLGPEFFVQIG
jgi:hypothetical protein